MISIVKDMIMSALANFYLENGVSQVRGVQHLRWSHSIANINFYTSKLWAFFVNTNRLKCIIYCVFTYFHKFCDLENIYQGHDEHAQ